MLEQLFFHDLRNILGGLAGYSELLSLRSGDQTAETIVRLSRLLKAEVDAQALLTRAENGDFSAQFEILPAETLRADLKEIFDGHPVTSGHPWTLRWEGPLSLRTDRLVLVRILVNMLKNAFEASPPAGTVSLDVEPWSEGTRFVVTNDGLLDPEVAPRIFERTFTTKNQPGRGLGTYSMRLLAEGFLGAKVWFRSEPGLGTQFVLDLPR